MSLQHGHIARPQWKFVHAQIVGCCLTHRMTRPTFHGRVFVVRCLTCAWPCQPMSVAHTSRAPSQVWQRCLVSHAKQRGALQYRARKVILKASSVTAPLAHLPVARPAKVRPREYLGCFAEKLQKLCPKAAKMQMKEIKLPKKCTHPHFIGTAMMRPILTVRTFHMHELAASPLPSVLPHTSALEVMNSPHA